jgi:CheY-like chemotaxis protein
LEMPYDKVPRRRPPAHAPGPESDLRLALPSRVRALARIAVMATTVLVIDDDPAFRALAVRMLVGMGLAVVGEAGTVEGARKAADSLRPESALVDVGLPDGDGVTLAAMLASLPWRPRIVLTSSDPEATTPADARSVGAASFIAKDDLPGSGLRALLTGPGDQEYG